VTAIGTSVFSRSAAPPRSNHHHFRFPAEVIISTGALPRFLALPIGKSAEGAASGLTA
jgi:hypothetical protein